MNFFLCLNVNCEKWNEFGDVRVDPLLTPMKPYSTLHSSIVNVTFKLSLPISNSPWPNQYHMQVSIRIYRFHDLEVSTCIYRYDYRNIQSSVSKMRRTIGNVVHWIRNFVPTALLLFILDGFWVCHIIYVSYKWFDD